MELLENDLIEGSSGRFGKRLVYRQRGGKTIIARRPARRKKADSARQHEVREIFSEGVLYAKEVVADELRKAIYQAKVTGNQSAFNLALSDFCKAPEIKKWNTSQYSGQVGDQIKIRAIDDFLVISVSIVIKDNADTTIEEGAAVLGANGADWIYTATVLNPSLPGTKIIIGAADMPGNTTIQEVEL